MKSFFQSNFPGIFEHIRPPRSGSRCVCRICLAPSPDMSGPPYSSKQSGLSSLVPSSKEVCRYPVTSTIHRLSSLAGHIRLGLCVPETITEHILSLDRTCLAHQPLIRVKSLHWTCPVPGPGSRDIRLLGAYKRRSPPSSLSWPLYWRKNPLNQSFFSSNSLSFKLHSNRTLLWEIWAILWVTHSIFNQSTSLMISVCSLLLGICPLDRLGVLCEPPRLWWASESLCCPLLRGDLLVENWTRSWWSFDEVWGQERPDPLWAPQWRHRQPLWLAKLWEQIFCLLWLLRFYCCSCSSLFLLKFDLILVVILSD
jgi:hypothetical protein